MFGISMFDNFLRGFLSAGDFFVVDNCLSGQINCCSEEFRSLHNCRHCISVKKSGTPHLSFFLLGLVIPTVLLLVPRLCLYKQVITDDSTTSALLISINNSIDILYPLRPWFLLQVFIAVVVAHKVEDWNAACRNLRPYLTGFIYHFPFPKLAPNFDTDESSNKGI